MILLKISVTKCHFVNKMIIDQHIVLVSLISTHLQFGEVSIYIYLYFLHHIEYEQTFVCNYFKGGNFRETLFREPKKSRNFGVNFHERLLSTFFARINFRERTTFNIFRRNKLSRTPFCGKRINWFFYKKTLSHAHISKMSIRI